MDFGEAGPRQLKTGLFRSSYGFAAAYTGIWGHPQFDECKYNPVLII